MTFASRFPCMLVVAALATLATSPLNAADPVPTATPLPPTATDLPVTRASPKKKVKTPSGSRRDDTGYYAQNSSEGYKTGARSLTLDEAVQLALKQNPDILKALQDIQRTKGQIFQVAAQGVPNLIGTGNYLNTDNKLRQGLSSSSGNTTSLFVPLIDPQTGVQTGVLDLNRLSSGSGSNSSLNNTYLLNIQLRQLIYNGGAVFAAVRGAKLTADNSFYQLRETVETVVNNVKTQFANILQNEALIRIQEEQVALLASQLKDQQNRFSAGTVPRFDVLQAEVALANQRPLLINAQNNYRISQLQLSQTLGYDYVPGRDERPPFRVIGQLEVIPFNINIADAVAIAEKYRPLLRLARQNVMIQQENVKVQKAGYLPTINATANYLLQNDRRSQDLRTTDNGYTLGGNITWNVFDGGLTYGKVRQARAEMLQSAVTYEDTRRSIGLAVQDALSRLRQSLELVNSQRENVGKALESVRLSQARLSAGAGTQLDVLNAQVALSQAQVTELQARYSYTVALADLRRVTGTSSVYVDNFTDPVVRRDLIAGVTPNPLVNKYANRGRIRPLPEKIDAEKPTYKLPTFGPLTPMPLPLPTTTTSGK